MAVFLPGLQKAKRSAKEITPIHMVSATRNYK
jgi:hypothetical protein